MTETELQEIEKTLDNLIHHAKVVERYSHPSLQPLSDTDWIICNSSHKQIALIRAELESTVRDLQRQVADRDALINDIRDGMIRVVRRVVCAAIRAADGDVLVGVRHYSLDMHQQIEARSDGAKFKHRHDEDQGFVDQYGAFMSREEAYGVAQAAGQISRPDACGHGLNGPKLYSEGLY